MEANTKKGLIIGGSIAAVVLIAGGITLGVVLGGKNSIENTISSNDYGIGAFANLESFDNDGFNNGVKKAGERYLGEYDGNSSYFVNNEKSKLEKKTSFYSDDGHEYVNLLIDYFSSNDIVISAGFQVGGAITGSQDATTGFDGVFTKQDGTDTAYANSTEKAFVLMDDESLATIYDNTASVSFAAEGAGYLSAQIAWMYTQYDAATNHAGEEDYTPNIVMWGGLNFPTVYDYMSGFAQGITELNNGHAGELIEGTTYTTQAVTLWSGGTTANEAIDAKNTYDVANVAATDYDGSTWYTGGFDAADDTTSGGNAKIKTVNAIANGASVVFPIAGGNTSVAENELVKAGSETTTKLLGVDADATIASQHDDLYIASAQKNLEEGGAIALWTMDDFDNDGIRNFKDDVDAEDTVGQKLADESILADWQVTESTSGDAFVGAGVRGTISNGGVGVIYGSAQQEAQGTLTPTLDFFGIDEEILATYLDSLSSADVTNNDGNFVNFGLPTK